MRKSFRVLITDKCNMSCSSCFNKELRTDKEMTLAVFEELCIYLKNEGHITRLKIMGGEPTTHREFRDILCCAQRYFQSVHLFTNAVNDVVRTVQMRPQDTIIYNIACMPFNFDHAKLLLSQTFHRCFETRIEATTDVPRIMRVLSGLHRHMGNAMVVRLTLNCMENMFKNRDVVISNWNAIVDGLQNRYGLSYVMDHDIPYCFFVGSGMKVQMQNALCDLTCAGLVSPDLKLRHCNQTVDTLLALKQGERFVPYSIVERHLLMEHCQMAYKCLQKICKDCLFYGRKCNGGCFMFKDVITAESVLSNTDLPVQ